MKSVKHMAAQGDVLIRRVKKMSSGLLKSDDNIITHSESGHHHVAEGTGFQIFNTSDPLVSYMKVTAPFVDIVHKRDYDTHETLRLDSNGEGEVIWEIRRQREFSPEGWRQVAD